MKQEDFSQFSKVISGQSRLQILLLIAGPEFHVILRKIGSIRQYEKAGERLVRSDDQEVDEGLVHAMQLHVRRQFQSIIQ